METHGCAIGCSATETEKETQGISRRNVLRGFAATAIAGGNANNFQLWSVISASRMRSGVLQQAPRKAAQNAAPAYCYRFDWQSPVLEGRPMALHSGELPFVFENTARCANMTGNGPAARDLAAKMSEAWIHFAHTGDPNHPDLPHSKKFDPSTNGTMTFDNECAFREHLDEDCQRVINA